MISKNILMVTRIAAHADIPSLIEMMREFYAESNYSLGIQWAEKSFSSLLQDNSRGAAWIVYDDAIAAGYVVLTFRFSMEFGGVDAFVDDLFVRARYRRRGLGKILLAALFDECKRRSILAVHVETSTDNLPVMALYGSFGMRDRRRTLLTARLTTRAESPMNENRA